MKFVRKMSRHRTCQVDSAISACVRCRICRDMLRPVDIATLASVPQTIVSVHDRAAPALRVAGTACATGVHPL